MGGLATIKINMPVEKSVRCPLALNPEFKLSIGCRGEN